MGEHFADALIAKQQQGVSVHSIHASVGTLLTPAAFFQRMIDNGIQVLEFNPVNPVTALAARQDWTLNQRDYRKLLIVDGHTAFIGGINTSSVYSGGSVSKRSTVRAVDSPPWGDTHLQLQGPVVAELQKLFIASWQAQQGPPLPAKAPFPPPRPVLNAVVRAIEPRLAQLPAQP